MKKIQLLCVAILIGIIIYRLWTTGDLGVNSESDIAIIEEISRVPRPLNVFSLEEVDRLPKPLHVFPPAYPFSAKRDRIEGRVIIEIEVTAEGAVGYVGVVESFPEGVFDACAMLAAKGYRFRPGMKDGKPVSTFVKMPISFCMGENCDDSHKDSIDGGQADVQINNEV